MTKKADFNAEEWSTLVEAPLLAGMRVMAASRGGTIRESMAMGQTYVQARKQQGESELLDDLVASPPAMDPSRLQSAGDIGETSTSRLREAVGLLEKKAPEDVESYRRFVVALAEAAAGAHREGGFMGVGGEQVSSDEKAALDEVQAALQSAS